MSEPISTETIAEYKLDEQVGYLLRLASQRHSAIFLENTVEGLTPTQFSTLIRISEKGEVSQNHLGRLAAMDVATIKGVVDRLKTKGLVTSRPDPDDKRRSIIALTPQGIAQIDRLKDIGYKYSTKGGLSISIDAMITPDSKWKILSEAERQVEEISRQYTEGLITQGEKYNKVVDIWAKATDDVANEMMAAMRLAPVIDTEGR